MRNGAISILHQSRESRFEKPWGSDHAPTLRLKILYGLIVLPICAIALRVAHLQLSVADSFIEGFDVRTETIESIVAADGRILGADGRVLAQDIERFEISVHYRWIEDPPDRRWLRQQAAMRLTRDERRHKQRLLEAEADVLKQRDEMWKKLADAAGISSSEMTSRRRNVQRRIERIIASVETRQRERETSSLTTSSPRFNQEETKGNFPLWRRVIRSVVETLTTPPRRSWSDQIVVQEELEFHRVFEDVPASFAREIDAHPERYPAVRVEVFTQRSYPEKSLAAHVVGSRLPIRGEDIRARKERYSHGDPLDYQPHDRIGRTGVERAFDTHLHGIRGLKRIVRNRHGEVVKVETVREPRLGRDVRLTLHLTLQEQLEQILDEAIATPIPQEKARLVSASPSDVSPGVVNSEVEEKLVSPGGCIIVMDVHTGSVLAAVSAPRFDLELLVNPDTERWERLLEDSRRPLFNRPTQMALPPGSVFKALTSIALLESGKIDPDAPFDCRGYLDRPDRHRCMIYQRFGQRHGGITLDDAMAKSCNVYFFDAARKIGPEPILHWARQFGFGSPTGIDLPNERAGNLPQPPVTSRPISDEVEGWDLTRAGQRDFMRNNPRWYLSETLGISIGQGRLTATPLQIVRLMAAIANDGRLVVPHVVQQIGEFDSGSRQQLLLSERMPRSITGIGSTTLARVREGLDRVVSHPGGTGYKSVRMEQVRIAGKTGTAEVGAGRPDHAWFAGYLPADRPQLAFVVVLEHAGSGGEAAGPVAKRLAQTLVKLGLVDTSSPRRVTSKSSNGSH